MTKTNNKLRKTVHPGSNAVSVPASLHPESPTLSNTGTLGTKSGSVNPVASIVSHMSLVKDVPRTLTTRTASAGAIPGGTLVTTHSSVGGPSLPVATVVLKKPSCSLFAGALASGVVVYNTG